LLLSQNFDTLSPVTQFHRFPKGLDRIYTHLEGEEGRRERERERERKRERFRSCIDGRSFTSSEAVYFKYFLFICWWCPTKTFTMAEFTFVLNPTRLIPAHQRDAMFQ